MPPELAQLFHDLNLEKLRIRRPSKFIFFCGGPENPAPPPTWSLRQYLLRDKAIESRLAATIVLAERANQLYRDANYHDLISFEEDVARIAALVLLIAESPGSLAEFGSFTSWKTVEDNLAVIVQTKYEADESFIRYGPIQRLLDRDTKRVGFYPWLFNKSGHLIKRTAKPHFGAILKFIKNNLKRTPNEELYRINTEIQDFIVILWVLYLGTAIPITDLFNYMESLLGMEQREVRNKLYCMKLAGWVEKYPYDNKVYWFATSNEDPFSRYAFQPGVVRDTTRRKTDVVARITADLKVPKHVREHVDLVKLGGAA